METRILRGEEQQALFPLFQQAFEHGSRDESDFNDWMRDFRDYWTTVGVYDANGIQACVLVNAYEAHWGPNVVLPLGGVDGVATLPAVRGKGYAGAGLKRALELMRENGQCVSMLAPFNFDFYRKYGWEWVGRRRRYEIPTRVMKSSPETVNVRAARPEDRAAVIGVYTRYAARYRGMLKRHEAHWNEILDDKKDKFTYTYLYERDDQPEGYLTFRGGEQKKTKIREFIALTPAAQRGLLGLLRRHEMQTDKFQWQAPKNDPLWLQFMVNGMETKLTPLFMGRVVDFQAALQAWKPNPGGTGEKDTSGNTPASNAIAQNGSLTLALADEYAPWNAGTWRVTIEDGQITAQATTDSPHVSLDIQAFSQAFFGTPTLAELRAAERLTVHDEAGFTVLARWLFGPPMYINDSF